MYIIYFFIYFYQFLFFYFFFFQAEDGIRDGHVTGVQTCALPISGHSYAPGARESAATEEAIALSVAGAALRSAGVIDAERAERSGGSTPTALLHADPPVTELRPGVYVFYDAQQLELGVCRSEQIALPAAATVV